MSNTDQPDPAMEAKMSTAQLGGRVNRLETDVGEMRVEVTRSTSSIEGMRGEIARMFEKLDQWGGAISGSTATKGMIPATYVTWAVGVFVSLIGVGLTLMTLAAGIVLFAMNGNRELDGQRMDYITQSMAADDLQEREDTKKFSTMTATAAKRAQGAAVATSEIMSKVVENERELDIFWEWYHPFLEEWGRVNNDIQHLSQDRRLNIRQTPISGQ